MEGLFFLEMLKPQTELGLQAGKLPKASLRV